MIVARKNKSRNGDKADRDSNCRLGRLGKDYVNKHPQSHVNDAMTQHGEESCEEVSTSIRIRHVVLELHT